jgi:K+ transporter
VDVPPIYAHFSKRFPCRPKVLVFVTVSAVNVAFVKTDFSIQPVEGFDQVFRIVYYHGYCERPPTANKVALRIIQAVSCLPGDRFAFSTVATEESAILDTVNPTFIVGHDGVGAKEESTRLHRTLVAMFDVLLHFSRSPLSALDIPFESTMEIGLHVKI